jgi:hypothetical protein
MLKSALPGSRTAAYQVGGWLAVCSSSFWYLHTTLQLNDASLLPRQWERERLQKVSRDAVVQPAPADTRLPAVVAAPCAIMADTSKPHKSAADHTAAQQNHTGVRPQTHSEHMTHNHRSGHVHRTDE